MNISFRRITSSGNFIPEIDGLRFIAIVSVVLFHLRNFINAKDPREYTDTLDYSFFQRLLSHGHFGVPLFFVISGFILGLPFAKFHISQQKPVSIRKYFIRRLTRLELPYILVMTTLLFGAVYVAKVISFNDGILSYLSSLIYSHNLIYLGIIRSLNSSTWSLEIEIQFYVLAPLMAYMFSFKNPQIRRITIFLTIMLLFAINQLHVFTFLSIINFCHLFLIGFILADLYVSQTKIFSQTKFDWLIGLCFFVMIWLFDKDDFTNNYQRLSWEIIQLLSIFFFYYYVLFHKVFKFLTLGPITNIGGMCYSIYLLHYPIISMFGNPLLKYTFSEYALLNISIYSAILIFLIAAISSLFFLLIERPCMNNLLFKKKFKEDVTR